MPNDGLTQRIGRNEVLKSNIITNEERRDNGNGWDSRRCVDVFGRRRDWHVINLIQSLYEQENISTQVEHCSTIRCPPWKVREWRCWMWGLLLKSGAIRLILDTAGQKSGSYRRGLVPRRKNCPCDLMMGCASADFTDGTARTSIIRHSLIPMLPSESSICHTNLATTIYTFLYVSYLGVATD